MATQRTIKRIRPGRVDVFDDQFWPVLVALCVLAAIGIGAAITLLTGPWMWLSLMILPAMTAGSLFLLSRMGNTKLRRTLQFSLLISLASHLMILIIASLILIFNSGQKKTWSRVAKRKVRTIEFSNTKNTVSIPVSKPDNTPEPEVEIERNETSVTSTEQPVPVKQTQPTVSPQTQRRETTQQTVPRFSEALAQLRRNANTRNSSNSSTANSPNPTERKVSVSKPSPAAKAVKKAESEAVTAASEAESIQRSSSISADRKVIRDSKTREVPKVEVAKSSELPKPTRPSPNLKSSQSRLLERSKSASSRPANAVARIRQPQPKMRKETAKPSASAAKSRTAENAAKMQPSEASGQLTRRPRRSENISVAERPSPVTRKKNSQPKRSTVSRRDNPTEPTVTNRLSSSRSTRLATNDAPTIRSMDSATRPAPNPKSSENSEAVESRTLSITKGQSGTAGAVAKQNMQSGEGGLPSPAVRPSDAIMNRKTQSPESTVQMLTNSQAARVRRSTAEAPQPKSAFKANTSNAAKIAGSASPSLESVESSAAQIDSASSRSREKVAIEKGAASVNLGPTKVVAEVERRKLSGGGSPEVSSLNPSQTRRSSSESTEQPSLASVENGSTAAPRETASQPSESASEEPTELAEIDQRSEGTDSQIADKDASPNLDPSADEGAAAASQLAALRRESNNDGDLSLTDRLMDQSSSDSGDDDDEEEERLRKLMGDSAVRIASAPSTDRSRDPVAGTAGDATQTNDGTNSSVGEGDEAADAEIAARSSAGGAFSTAETIGQAATRMAVQAATSLPVIDGALARRSRPAVSNNSTRKLTDVSNSSKRNRSEAAPKVSTTVATTSSPSPGSGAARTQNDIAEDLADAELTRGEAAAAESGLKFDVSAIKGPAGIGETPDVSAGVNMRPAAEESKQLQPELDTRFRNNDFGGAPAMNPTATIAKEAFRQRTPGMAESAAEPKTEAAINLGLEFLARNQQPDGSWSLTRFDTEHRLHSRQLDSDMAATGLAVLAFQGAGYNHREFKYARQINHAIRWLIENQGKDGLLYLEADKDSNNACRLYSHGIAALALTEAYGMTQDPMVKEPAQKALDFIANTQHPTKGGWRYFAEMKSRSSDTSVSGWMVMALQSGRLSGLKVEDKTFESIVSWLKVAADPANESLYRYNPYAVNAQGVSRIQGRNATPSMTAVGLLMRIYSGWERDDPRLLSGARFLVQQQLPGESIRLRDTYYWYYATQVLKHVDGPEWETWNNTLRPLLIRTQEKADDNAGSWDPYSPAPDRWGPFGGRLYVTTMNLLSLEVRHRLLPLYQKTNDADDKEKPNPIVVSEKPFE